MLRLKDQLGNSSDFETRPLRIVSLVPSQSEYLWDIGLRDELVGITKFCIHPEEMFRSVERVGGTKMLDIDKIRRLKPDLIIGNKEENEASQIKVLQKEFKVWMSDIYNFEDAFNMMLSLGSLLGKSPESSVLVHNLRQSLENCKNHFEEKSVLYFIWNDPYMCAAKNTFIDFVLNHIGLKNVASEMNRYPELTVEQLQSLQPEFCFLSSEPYPFKNKHVQDLKRILPKSKIIIVDGEIFSWYGSRLLKLEEYLRELRGQLTVDS